MKRTYELVVASLAVVGGAVGCDLPELQEALRADAAGAPASGDAAPSPPDAAVSPQPDAMPSAPGSCDPADWLASASAAHPVNPPAYAIDRLAPTRWSSGTPQAVGQFFQVDFGGVVTIGEIELVHAFAADGAGDYARGVDVRVSGDGQVFAEVAAAATTAGDPGASVAIEVSPRAARAVRLELTAAAPASWWTLHDLRIECTSKGGPPAPGDPPPAGPDEPLPATGVNPNRDAWTATASAGDEHAALAFDGDPDTRWTTSKAPQYGDEWYELDLGAVLDIRAVWLATVGDDHPSSYRLSLSSDGATYTPVATGLGDDLTQIAFAARPARHVRIEQIGSGHDAWWSIAELTVLE